MEVLESPSQRWEFAPEVADTPQMISEQAKDTMKWLIKDEAERGEGENRISIIRGFQTIYATMEASMGKRLPMVRNMCDSTKTISPRTRRTDHRWWFPNLGIHKMGWGFTFYF